MRTSSVSQPRWGVVRWRRGNRTGCVDGDFSFEGARTFSISQFCLCHRLHMARLVEMGCNLVIVVGLDEGRFGLVGCETDFTSKDCCFLPPVVWHTWCVEAVAQNFEAIPSVNLRDVFVSGTLATTVVDLSQWQRGGANKQLGVLLRSSVVSCLCRRWALRCKLCGGGSSRTRMRKNARPNSRRRSRRIQKACLRVLSVVA